MPKLHLVCGLSGTGKTEYSKNLAKQLDILKVSPDDIYASLKASSPELKQKDIAEIFNMTPSSFCKMIQKNNKP